MNHFLSWIVGSSKPRWTFRVAMGCVLLVFSWIYSSIHSMQVNFQQRMAIQSEMWRLEEEVRILQEQSTDSILEQSRDSATARMLHGWHDFAIWTEKVRTTAEVSEVDMDWKVGDLMPLPGYGIPVEQIPLTIKVLPWSRSFEHTMRYVEKIVRDSTLAWRLEEVWMQGAEEGVVDTRFALRGWMLP